MRQRTTNLLLAVLLLLVAVPALAGPGSGATYTDTGSAGGNAFTTGTVDLKLSDSDQTDADAVTASITLGGLGPGDAITRRLTVRNANGSIGQAVDARYAVSSSVAVGSSTLARRLDLLIGRQGNGSGTCDPSASFGNASPPTGTNWRLIYQGDLARSTDLHLIGNPAAGQDAAASGQISGDRAVAGNGGTEYLCLRITFRDGMDEDGSAPLTGEGNKSAHSYVRDDGSAGEDNAYKDLAATVTFTFAAEQASAGTGY